MEIKTKRLTLSNLVESDRENLFDLYSDNVVNKTYLLPDFDGIESFAPMFNNLLRISNEGKSIFLALRLNGELIGVIHQTSHDANEDFPEDATEIGYCLRTKFHKNGYMSEAFTALIPHLFSLGYKTVVAGAFEDNPASLRVMEKSGLKPIDKVEFVDYRGASHRIVFRSIDSPSQ